jgi:hypothetical protein
LALNSPFRTLRAQGFFDGGAAEADFKKPLGDYLGPEDAHKMFGRQQTMYFQANQLKG